jgi:hypothetical protein
MRAANRAFAAALVALVALVAVTAPATAFSDQAAFAGPAAPAHAPAHAPAPTHIKSITRSAHVAFDNCNARHIILSVTAPAHAFTPNQTVTVTVRLRNTGSTTCGPPLARHVPEARRVLSVGPCGTLPLTVRTVGGVAVYPGTQVFFCPEAIGVRLGPHSAIQATGYWAQEAYLGPGNPPEAEHAPPATYRLTVDRVVTVPITLASG